MDFKTIYELLEIEYYEETWNSIGLFESEDLLKDFKSKREEELRSEFGKGDSQNTFNDWYKWIVRERKLYIDDTKRI